MDNEMTLSFVALSENESLARIAVTSFVAQLDPTIDELSEFKTIVSEAVSNAIIHGYDEDGKGIVTVHAVREGDVVSVAVKDQGKGIPDIKKAMEPLFTTKADMERSGMGFTIMESFADHLQVESEPGVGTVVTFSKKFHSMKMTQIS
ncbi:MULTISPECIES: anti-sigma F factor [Ureibacillus]|jgi:stage II sporulation protein AB (anti-sigma F factor)|uniref:Anti-sigma F factor n=1 Tax=Ureibacillus thermosphaericus TaxID=51173 RepID=A0A840PML0_URETH|nr:anti-sigma F factor [Ureibacillus thermosphaericus]MBB5147729.1 stage II sporulation protein AB (anti-sigma F factor) [Ureibacillus thermosphaericus]NKZ30468.1 anti-sigma F factor [Ureibacillus thermosphaericus]